MIFGNIAAVCATTGTTLYVPVAICRGCILLIKPGRVVKGSCFALFPEHFGNCAVLLETRGT